MGRRHVAVRALQQEDPVTMALERDQISLKDVEHGAAKEARRTDPLRDLEDQQEVLAQSLGRHRHQQLVALLVGVEEPRAQRRAFRDLGEFAVRTLLHLLRLTLLPVPLGRRRQRQGQGQGDDQHDGAVHDSALR